MKLRVSYKESGLVDHPIDLEEGVDLYLNTFPACRPAAAKTGSIRTGTEIERNRERLEPHAAKE